jgi:CRP-like cAMP-binding protein
MKKRVETKTFASDDWDNESDRLLRQREIERDRLHEALSRVMKVTSVGNWMETSNPAFEGFSPREVIDRGEIDLVWKLIHRSEFSRQELPATGVKHAEPALPDRFEDLRRVRFFAEMKEPELKTLAAGSITRRYFAGEEIVRQGNIGSELFAIRSGKVDVFKCHQTTQDKFVRTLGRGDVFGEMALLTGDRRSATVRAREDCEVIVVGKAALSEVLNQAPSLLKAIAEIAEKRTVLEDDLTSSGSMPVVASHSPSLFARMRDYFGL